mmetsp:Transcript_58926/g.184781  ORF Transcript_58926/g.184781 Transcript_58926/m.184781 type:complete len:214 (+) Transcript_58926:1280-1921(+)
MLRVDPDAAEAALEVSRCCERSAGTPSETCPLAFVVLAKMLEVLGLQRAAGLGYPELVVFRDVHVGEAGTRRGQCSLEVLPHPRAQIVVHEGEDKAVRSAITPLCIGVHDAKPAKHVGLLSKVGRRPDLLIERQQGHHMPPQLQPLALSGERMKRQKHVGSPLHRQGVVGEDFGDIVLPAWILWGAREERLKVGEPLLWEDMISHEARSPDSS